MIVFIKTGHGQSNVNIPLYSSGKDCLCQLFFLLFYEIIHTSTFSWKIQQLVAPHL